VTIEVVSASAGSGKTHFLAEQVSSAVAQGTARPEAVLAVTFTTRAANELRMRLRSKVDATLGAPAGIEHARIGTVHAVASGWLRDLAFELGTSPNLRVLSEPESRELFRTAIDEAVALEDADRTFMRRLTPRDWSDVAFDLATHARANRIPSHELPRHADHSIRTILAALPPPTNPTDLAALHSALDELVAIPTDSALAATTRQIATDARSRLKSRAAPAWDLLDRLSTLDGAAPQRDACDRIRELAGAYITDPEFGGNVVSCISHAFLVAARALETYSARKRAGGVVDFTDLEEQFLAALERPEIAEIIHRELDLFVVDELQDSSPLQVALFLRLASLAKRSIWVGDLKQAIFGFRGTDPRLMAGLVRGLSDAPRVLDRSWRSRAPLVDVTNHVFSPPFEAAGVPTSQVALIPASPTDDRALGVYVERWRVHGDNRAAQHEALASLVTKFLSDHTVKVRDVVGTARSVQPEDVAILCRTQATCFEVAQNLRLAGHDVAGPTTLDAAPEVMLVIAILRLAVDAEDRIAHAEIARILDEHPDGSTWASTAFDPPAEGWWLERGSSSSSVCARLDEILARPELRELAAAWGKASTRMARLELLRQRAYAYESSVAEGSIAGFLEWVSRTSDASSVPRVPPAPDRVNVLTWHGSKGLEWPVVVLYDLHRIPSSTPCGVVVDGPADVDASAPLRERLLRFWPQAVSERQTRGPFATAMASAAEGLAAARVRSEEELRLLYVAWTRARDRLALAARPSRLSEGVLSLLQSRGLPLVREPMVRATWGRKSFEVVVRDSGPLVLPNTFEPEQVPLRHARERRPATVAPSERTGEGEVLSVDELGVEISFGTAPTRALGIALHEVLTLVAMDSSKEAFEPLVVGALRRHSLDDHLLAPIVTVIDRFLSWVRAHPPATLLCNVPVEAPLADGSRVVGEADLILRGAADFAVLDHKLHIAAREDALRWAASAAAQLDHYAAIATEAWRQPCRARYVHLPAQGLVVRVAPPSSR